MSRKIKGWKHLVYELGWHNKNSVWDYPYEVHLNKGKMRLDVFN